MRIENRLAELGLELPQPLKTTPGLPASGSMTYATAQGRCYWLKA